MSNKGENIMEEQQMKETTNEKVKEEVTVSKTYKDFSLKRWILVGITAFALLFSIIALAFPYATVSAPILGQEHSLTGFIAIFGGTGPAVLEEEYGLTSFLACVHLGAIAWCIYMLLNSVFKKDEEKTKKSCDIIWILTSIPCIITSALGTHLTGVANSVFEAQGAAGLVSVTSAAGVLFAVDIFAFAAYKLVEKFFVDDNVPLLSKLDSSKIKVPFANKEQSANVPNKETSETLKSYKDLLDKGAITQEEYDKIKENLLNK